MARTSSIFARIEPEIKEQAEKVLAQLGIPMSNAIGIFLRQVVLQRGMPFEIKLPQNKPLAIGALGEEQFNAEIEKGLADLATGKVVSADRVAERMQREEGVLSGMAARKLTAIIEREGDGYVSLCPELEIASQGSSIEESRDNLQDALELFFECASQEEAQQCLRGEVYITQVEMALG